MPTEVIMKSIRSRISFIIINKKGEKVWVFIQSISGTENQERVQM